MIEEVSKQKALAIFNSFETLMRPLLALFPDGQIEWRGGLVNDHCFDFEGEFRTEDGSYIRFTEEVSRGGEKE